MQNLIMYCEVSVGKHTVPNHNSGYNTSIWIQTSEKIRSGLYTSANLYSTIIERERGYFIQEYIHLGAQKTKFRGRTNLP